MMDFIRTSSVGSDLKLTKLEYSGLFYPVEESRKKKEEVFIQIPQTQQEILSSPSLGFTEKYFFLPLLKDISNWDGKAENPHFMNNFGDKPFLEYLTSKKIQDLELTNFISYCMAVLPTCLLIFFFLGFSVFFFFFPPHLPLSFSMFVFSLF
jgi:RAB protein geranylgeranyltransferase component A